MDTRTNASFTAEGRPCEVTTMTEEVVTLRSLQQALARCMTAHPPEGIELRLHEDANPIAGLWALMSYERTESVRVDQMKTTVLDAYKRWAV